MTNEREEAVGGELPQLETLSTFVMNAHSSYCYYLLIQVIGRHCYISSVYLFRTIYTVTVPPHVPSAHLVVSFVFLFHF